MSSFIVISQGDMVFILVAFFIALVSQTKTSAITALEFLVYNVAMNAVIYFGVSSPFLWLTFCAICYISAHLHVICTSHWLVTATFKLSMLYNLAMFYDWGSAQWVAGGQYGIFDKYHTASMVVIVVLQLLTTAVYGGFYNGLVRWKRSIADRDNPYLRVAQGES